MIGQWIAPLEWGCSWVALFGGCIVCFSRVCVSELILTTISCFFLFLLTLSFCLINIIPTSIFKTTVVRSLHPTCMSSDRMISLSWSLHCMLTCRHACISECIDGWAVGLKAATEVIPAVNLNFKGVNPQQLCNPLQWKCRVVILGSVTVCDGCQG